MTRVHVGGGGEDLTRDRGFDRYSRWWRWVVSEDLICVRADHEEMIRLHVGCED